MLSCDFFFSLWLEAWERYKWALCLFCISFFFSFGLYKCRVNLWFIVLKPLQLVRYDFFFLCKISKLRVRFGRMSSNCRLCARFSSRCVFCWQCSFILPLTLNYYNASTSYSLTFSSSPHFFGSKNLCTFTRTQALNVISLPYIYIFFF